MVNAKAGKTKAVTQGKKTKAIGAPYINQKWSRVMAVGCSHGSLANEGIKAEVLAFRDRYRPEIRFDLGDLVDATAFRNGAKGTPDEGVEPQPDIEMAEKWIESYSPTHILFGNHDARLEELQESQNAIISHAAKDLWGKLTAAAKSVHAKTKPYDFENGWFEMGGTGWTHGYWYNENAVRDHAEYFGGPIVMAHLHVAQQAAGRTRKFSASYCVGTLADIPKMHYARRRRATSRWSPGVVWGELSDKSSHLNLTCCEKDESLRFPL